MAASKELVTKIILKAHADSSISKAFTALSKSSDTCINKLTKIGDTAKKAFKTVAAATAAGALAVAKSAIDFESAFASVQKTVDETDTTSYEDLANGIRQLAKETPSAATDIAEVAAAAGQLGIKADDVLTFTKTMIDLGETTNLTSDEAATSIAKMFNITGTSMDSVDKFGATLVALGNNAATTESDIMNMASRIASSATQVGMTEQELLALATSLSSVGLEAEGGGTAISTVMSDIDKAVALNSDSLSTWASTAGMSVSAFSKLWEKDAYGAMQKVVQGMGNTKSEGGNLNILLEELGITGIRTSDTMKRLSSASGLMSEMTDLANKSWNENTALSKEANTRYATTASRLQILRNKINDAAITVGNALLPVINKLIDKMDEVDMDAIADKVVNACNWIIENFDKIKVALGVLAAAFVTFKIASFINTISGAVKELKHLSDALKITDKINTFTAALKKTSIVQSCISGFNKFKTALSNFSITQTLATAKQWLFNTSLYGCPIVWIIAGIAALIAIIVLLVKNWDKVKEAAVNCWNGIKSAVSKVGEWLKNFFTVTIPNAINSMVQWFAQLPSKIWNWLLNVINKVIAFRAMIIQKAIEIGKGFLNKIVEFFKQLPYKIGYCIGYAIGKVIQFGQKLWNFATVTIPQFIGKVAQWFAQLPGKIWTWLVNAAQKVAAWGSNLWAKAKEIGRNFINSVVNFFKTLPSKVWTWLVNTVTKIKTWGSNVISVGKAKAKAFLSSVVNFFKQLPSKIWSWLTNTVKKVTQWGVNMVAKAKKAASDTFNAVVNKIKELPGKMLEFGKNIVKGLWNGIKNAKDWLIGKIKSFANGITDGIKAALGIKSPSTVMMKLAKFVPQGFGIGILNNAKYAVNAVKAMGGKVTAAASKIAPTFSGTTANIQKFGTGGTITSPQLAVVGDVDETIVPHGNTPRNRALLSEAAKGVGATGGGNVFNFTFAPVINGGNAEENRAMIQDEEDAFERRMEAWIAKNRRLAFNV